jgi:hypothetical protein
VKEYLIKHRLLIIIPVVVVIFIIVAVIVGRFRGGDAVETMETGPGGRELVETGYFANQYYPVNTREEADGSLIITADGSLTPELAWSYDIKDPEKIEAEQIGEEENGMLSLRVSPLSDGYATVTLKKTGKIGDADYTAAEIDVNTIVNLYEDGSLAVCMSDIYQDASMAGAADSEYPFIIDQNRILLPNGGDWEATESTVSGEKSAGLFDIYRGRDDSGMDYIGIYTDVENYYFLMAETLQEDGGTDAQLPEDIKKAMDEGKLTPEEIAELEESMSQPSLSDEDQAMVEKISDARLIIKSESLGQSYTLTYQIGDQNEGLLKIEDATATDAMEGAPADEGEQ